MRTISDLTCVFSLRMRSDSLEFYVHRLLHPTFRLCELDLLDLSQWGFIGFPRVSWHFDQLSNHETAMFHTCELRNVSNVERPMLPNLPTRLYKNDVWQGKC